MCQQPLQYSKICFQLEVLKAETSSFKKNIFAFICKNSKGITLLNKTNFRCAQTFDGYCIHEKYLIKKNTINITKKCLKINQN